MEPSVCNFLMMSYCTCSHTSIKVNVVNLLSKMKHHYMKNIILFQIRKCINISLIKFAPATAASYLLTPATVVIFLPLKKHSQCTDFVKVMCPIQTVQ
jgi:hypothetical protein